MTQQEQRREAAGRMTTLRLTYWQSIGFLSDNKHAGFWVSEKAEKEYNKLSKLVDEIDGKET